MTIVLLIIILLWIYGLYGSNRHHLKSYRYRKEEEDAQTMYDTLVYLTKEYNYKLMPFYDAIRFIAYANLDLSNKTNVEINYFLSYPKHIYKKDDCIIYNGINLGKYSELANNIDTKYFVKFVEENNNNLILNIEDYRKEVETIGSEENAFYKRKGSKKHDGCYNTLIFEHICFKGDNMSFKDDIKKLSTYFNDKRESNTISRQYKDLTPEYHKLHDDMKKAYKSGAKLEELEKLTLDFYVNSNIEYFKTHKLTDEEIEKRKTAKIINQYFGECLDEEIDESLMLFDAINDKDKTKDEIIDKYKKNNKNIKGRMEEFAKEFKVNTFSSNY